MPAQSRQLAAIMFTDIVGYTALMEDDEEKAFALLEKNRSIHKPLIKKYRGRFSKEMGDGILASFQSVTDAIYCAGSIQGACKKEKDLNIRIGIPQGEIVYQGDDVFGSGVNIASRIEAITPMGSIWVSDAVQRNIQNKKGIEIEFIREVTLKNIQQPIGIYEIRIKSSYLSTNLSVPNEKSIAVLPFVNISTDREQEYFCDGITEEIINLLTMVEDLKVIARTSAFAFKGQNVDIREIGQKLNVNHLLEGSVRKAGNKVRITTQLINADDGAHLWSESYDRQLEDVFAVQDEISLAIVEKLKLKITGEEAKFAHKQTVNRAAHEAYLKGRYFWNQRGPGLKKSIQFFEIALAEEDGYALAYAGLADAYALLGFYGYLPPREVMPKAKNAAKRALEIDENLAEAHCSLGYIYTIFDWDWEKAKKEFQQTFDLNPSYGPARYWYSNLLMTEGRLKEAITEVRLGAENDPLSVYMLTHLGIVLVTAHKYTEASEQLRKAIELERDSTLAHSVLGVAYYFQSRVEESIREIRKAIDSSNRHPWPVWMIGMVYAASGARTKAEEIVAELERRMKNEYIDETHIASIYALLGEKDQAFHWLEKAYEERAPLLFGVANGFSNWAFNSLKTDLRFKDLMGRIGLRYAD